VKIEFDPAKNERNIAERGIPCTLATEFDWRTAVVKQSDRDGEKRYAAAGLIRGKLYILVYVNRNGGLRVISLRRANRRETKHYEKAKS